MDTGLDIEFDARTPLEPGGPTRLQVITSDQNLTFIGRYYRLPTSEYPALTGAEADAIFGAGLSIIALFETHDDPAAFKPANGAQDAKAAYTQAVKLGQPAGTPIYFAIDNKLKTADVTAYFTAINTSFAAQGGAYTVGVYGSGEVCTGLLKAGKVTKTWLWAAYDVNPAPEPFNTWDVQQRIKDYKLPGWPLFGPNDPKHQNPSYDADQVKDLASAGAFKGRAVAV